MARVGTCRLVNKYKAVELVCGPMFAHLSWVYVSACVGASVTRRRARLAGQWTDKYCAHCSCAVDRLGFADVRPALSS
jgi:hypothetical protein